MSFKVKNTLTWLCFMVAFAQNYIKMSRLTFYEAVIVFNCLNRLKGTLFSVDWSPKGL